MLLEELRRWEAEAERRWIEAKARKRRNADVEEAYWSGRLTVLRQLIKYLSKDCSLCNDGFVNHKHLG